MTRERLTCDTCGATPLRGDDGDGVDAREGYLVGSDCPACATGELFDANEYGDDYEAGLEYDAEDALDDAAGEYVDDMYDAYEEGYADGYADALDADEGA